MQSKPNSPRIVQLSWGRMKIEGQNEIFKDAKLYPGGAREWDWRETGTRHIPGIQPADVHELLQHGAKVIVLSKGMDEQLQVPPETLNYLRDCKVQVHIHQTEEAVRLYNELCQTALVGGLFHSTC
ncbi:MAG: Mth938-like domain-containing protein [bacterium]